MMNLIYFLCLIVSGLLVKLLSLDCLVFKMEETIQNKRKALATIVLLSVLEKKTMSNSKKRSIWIKSWIKERKKFGSYHSLINELKLTDVEGYRRYLRMPHHVFMEILHAIEPYVQKQTTLFREAIPAGERLALTLRFLATGESMNSLHFQFRLGVSTVHGIIYETCQAIYLALRDKYLKFPQTPEEWLKIAKNFKDRWQYNNCIGALDGKHIEIFAPPNSGSFYFNYKEHFSVVLLALVDADCKAIYVDVGANGRAHDSSVLSNSSLGEMLRLNQLHLPPHKCLPGRKMPLPYVIVADEAFPLKENVMRPYSKRELNSLAKRLYNYRHSRARRVSENFFGILVQVFRIFLKKIQMQPHNVETIVLACVVLHNCLRTHNPERYMPEEKENHVPKEKKTDEIRHKMKPLQHKGCRGSVENKRIRDEFMVYYNGKGAVKWQLERVEKNNDYY